MEKASLEKGGEPPLGGGGIFLWNLLHDVIDLGVTPQSVLRTASSPKGEPKQKGGLYF